MDFWTTVLAVVVGVYGVPLVIGATLLIAGAVAARLPERPARHDSPRDWRDVGEGDDWDRPANVARRFSRYVPIAAFLLLMLAIVLMTTPAVAQDSTKIPFAVTATERRTDDTLEFSVYPPPAQRLQIEEKDADEVAEHIADLLDKLAPALKEAGRQDVGGYQIDTVEMHVIVSAEAGLKIIGAAGIEGGIKLTFKRRQPTQARANQ